MFLIAKLYACVYLAVRAISWINMPELGFMLRNCKLPRFIPFNGQQLFFEPKVSPSYGLHIIGRLQEPEAHKAVNQIFDTFSGKTSFFVDIDANVGAFILDIARRPEVNVIGFEPSEGCVRAILKTT